MKLSRIVAAGAAITLAATLAAASPAPVSLRKGATLRVSCPTTLVVRWANASHSAATLTCAPKVIPQLPPTDGTFRVGSAATSMFTAGTYTANSGGSCYWARLSGFGGTLDEVIANSYGTGPQVVTILPSDAGFATHGCGPWTKVAQ